MCDFLERKREFITCFLQKRDCNNCFFQEGGCNKLRPNSHRQAGPEWNEILLPEEEVPFAPVCSTITAR